MLLVGAGFGLALTPLNMAAITAVTRARSGVAAGILTTIGGLGEVFGIALSGGIFQEEQIGRWTPCSQPAACTLETRTSGR
jgi:hypothetical protein